MLLEGVACKDTVVLVDTNVMLEAVRTRCWNALAGGLWLETVEECRNEALRGDRGRPGYLPVGEPDLARIRTVHVVSAVERVTFAMAYADAQNMDPGERDLFAHAYGRVARGDTVWIITSADRACVRAAVALGWHDRMHSLAALAAAVGANPRPPLVDHHGERWLSSARTGFLLGSWACTDAMTKRHGTPSPRHFPPASRISQPSLNCRSPAARFSRFTARSLSRPDRRRA